MFYTIDGQFAQIGKSLANESPLEILDILCQEPHEAEALAKQVGQSIADTSHYLCAFLYFGA